MGGVGNFDDLSEAAKEKVRAYYEDQGLLYDELEELEKACAAYRELGEKFQRKKVYQEVAPCGASDRVMYFQTSVTLPVGYVDLSIMM